MRFFFIRIIGVFFLSLYLNNIFSQTKLVITNLEEEDLKLIITYDILNYNQEDLFDVYVELIKSSGNIIKPKNVKGDINKRIIGGEGYRIVWDLAADSIFINEDVEIQIGADISINISYFKYTSLLFSSTLLPGAGLKKIERKKSYLFFGLLGYSGIAATGYFYTQGYKSYTDYEAEKDPVKRIELLDLANKNNQNATIAGISTAAIWLLNYAWFTLRWNKKKKKAETASVFKGKFNFYANYHPGFKKTMFSIAYQF